MKIIAVLLTVTILLSGCMTAATEPKPSYVDPLISADQLIGKSLDELTDVLTVDQCMLAYGYGFGKDKAGNPVAFEWNLNEQEQFVITNAEIYPAKNVDNSPEVFENLEVGMTIYEAVELLGLPSSIPATGLFYIEFLDSEGNAYWLDWQGDPITYQFMVERGKQTD